MKKKFVKPEVKGIRLRENILASSYSRQPAVIHNGDDISTGIFWGKCKTVGYEGSDLHVYAAC